MTLPECFVNLANHPGLDNVAQIAFYNGFVHDPEGRTIAINVRVEHRNATTGVSLFPLIPHRRVQLLTNDTTWVNPDTFQDVQPSPVAVLDDEGLTIRYDRGYPPGSVNEYEYWTTLVENPIQLYPLFHQMIGLRALQGRFEQ